VFALAVTCAAACGNGEQRPPTSQPPPRPSKATLRLVALTDESGYLEPCGCQTRPLGGIDKAATALAELSADGTPALLVSAGNLFFEAQPQAFEAQGQGATASAASAELTQQQTWQAETLADALGKLGLVAAAPGAADALHDPAQLAGLSARGHFQWLGARAGAGAAADPARDRLVVERGGLRVGLFGLLATQDAAASDVARAAQQQVDALRSEGAALVVALLTADGRTARRVAGAVKRLDFLVQGGLGSPEVVPPERVGDTTVLRAADDGRGLLVVDLFRAGSGPFADASPWTQQARAQALQKRGDELRERIAAWARDPATDPALLAEQRAHLAALEAEQKGQRADKGAAGNAFSARFVELGPEVTSQPAMRAALDAHDARVNDHNRVAFANVAKLPVPPGTPSYTGSARCGDCHEAAFAWWRQHQHGRAYATLQKKNKQYNLSCVGCHVTGYGKPGGAAVVQNEGLVDVGCESCHGPGSLHAEDPDVDDAKNVVRDTPEAVCKTCHTPEHSDAFEYGKYKAKLIVPGHGQPEASAK